MKMLHENDIRDVAFHHFLSQIGWQEKRFNRKAGFSWLGARRLVIKLRFFELVRLCGYSFFQNEVNIKI
jgi:hypothetical protein